jgi:hypothetical protein
MSQAATLGLFPTYRTHCSGVLYDSVGKCLHNKRTPTRANISARVARGLSPPVSVDLIWKHVGNHTRPTSINHFGLGVEYGLDPTLIGLAPTRQKLSAC